MFASLVAISLLAAPAVSSEEKIWSLIYELESDAKTKGAAEQLKAIGLPALPIMLRAARLLGTAGALPMVNGQGCMMPMMGGFPGMPTSSGPSARAAKLLGEWAHENPAVREWLSNSDDELARTMALLAADRSLPSWGALLQKATRDSSPLVVKTAIEVTTWCHTFGDNALPQEEQQKLLTQLGARVEKLVPGSLCKDEREVGPLITRFTQSDLTVNGWGSGGEDTAYVGVTDGSHASQLQHRCAIALYDGLAKRGHFMVELLLPFLDTSMPAAARSAAGERAQRDVKHFPADKLDTLTTRLLNAGFSSAQKAKLPEDPEYANTDALEAAARQNVPGARSAIEQRFLCRESMGESVALLGYAPSQQNGDDAARVAAGCKNGGAAAVAALVRMKDPRAMTLMLRAVEDPWLDRSLAPALRDNWSPAWESWFKERAPANERVKRLYESVSPPKLRGR